VQAFLTRPQNMSANQEVEVGVATFTISPHKPFTEYFIPIFSILVSTGLHVLGPKRAGFSWKTQK
jgi:hypothetical protein